MIALNTTVDLSKYLPKAEQVRALLGPAIRKDLNEGGAKFIAALLRAHIGKYAVDHHGTADKIRGGPATRTGHLEDAAASVALGSITSESGEVTISSPGFRRALGPVTIVPKDKPALTVAIHADAYGKTYSDCVAEGMKIFRVHSKKTGGDYLAKRGDDKALVVLYALKQEVTLKHAPELLPEADEFKKAARDGVVDVVETRLSMRGQA